MKSIDSRLQAYLDATNEMKVAIESNHKTEFQAKIGNLNKQNVQISDLKDLEPVRDLTNEIQQLKAKQREYLSRIEQQDIAFVDYDQLRRQFEKFEQDAKILICSRNLPKTESESLEMLQDMRKQIATLNEERRRLFLR